MSEHPWLPRETAPSAFLAAAAVAAVVLGLTLLALVDAPGGALVGFTVVGALVLVAAAVVSRQITPAVVAAVLAAAALLALLGLELGGRAGRSADQGAPFPAVVGMKVNRARKLFEQHGPVKIVIQRVSYGQRDIVLRATGYGPHGTYGPGSTIRLVVGSRAPLSDTSQ